MNDLINVDEIRVSNLKKILIESGKSITQLAKECGMFTSNISSVLNGDRKFTNKLAHNIETNLGLKPGFLSMSIKENRLEYLIEFKTISQQASSPQELRNTGGFLSIRKDLLNKHDLKTDNLFAINSSFEIDKKALSNTIDESKTLIFDSLSTKLEHGKIYLLRYKSQFLLRRFILRDKQSYFETDQPDLYTNIIYDATKIECFGRLIFALNVVEF